MNKNSLKLFLIFLGLIAFKLFNCLKARKAKRTMKSDWEGLLFKRKIILARDPIALRL